MTNSSVFEQLPDTLAFTLFSIVQDGAPILHVTHDAEDGAWQFLGLETPDESDVMIVSLQEAIALDPALLDLADLPEGWHAWRESTEEPWTREPYAIEDEEGLEDL